MLGYQKSAAGRTPLTFGLLWETFETPLTSGLKSNTSTGP